MAKGVNVETYNIAAIEQMMQRMSSETADRLGETQRIPEKNLGKKKNTGKKKRKTQGRLF